jgi:hypothetical protein
MPTYETFHPVAGRSKGDTKLNLSLIADLGDASSLYCVTLRYPRKHEDDVGDIPDEEVIAFVHKHTVPSAKHVTEKTLRWEADERDGYITLAMCFFSGEPPVPEAGLAEDPLEES